MAASAHDSSLCGLHVLSRHRSGKFFWPSAVAWPPSCIQNRYL